MERSEQELKEALEYQIDIVLRLEEERQILLKENKFQKQKIQQLSILLEKYTTQQQTFKPQTLEISVQTDLPFQQFVGFENLMNQATQTEVDTSLKDMVQKLSKQNNLDEQELLSDNDSVFQYSHCSGSKINGNAMNNSKQQQNLVQNQQLSAFEQAQQLLKGPSPQKQYDIDNSQIFDCIDTDQSFQQQSQSKQKSSTSQYNKFAPNKSKMAVKNLQFKSNKENNKSMSNQSTVSTNLGSSQQKQEQEIISQEFVKLTREQNAMRKEMRKMEDIMKKKDKEMLDQKKSIEVKNEMLEKLRTELAELSLVLNQSNYKSIRTMEGELNKTKVRYQNLKEQNNQNIQEKEHLQKELAQFRIILEKLTQEYTNIQQNDTSKSIQEQNIKYQETIEDLQRNVDLKQKELNIKEGSIKELKQEMSKVTQEIDYFKNMSLQSKKHADRLLEDLDFYRSILIQHNMLPK